MKGPLALASFFNYHSDPYGKGNMMPDPHDGGWDPEKVVQNMTAEMDMYDENYAQVSKRKMTENLPFATDAIIYLAMHSESERMRFDAAKYVMERCLGKVSDQGITSSQDDPLDSFAAEFIQEIEEHVRTGGGPQEE